MIQYYQSSTDQSDVMIAKTPDGHQLQVKIKPSEEEDNNNIKADNLLDLEEDDSSDLMKIDLIEDESTKDDSDAKTPLADQIQESKQSLLPAEIPKVAKTGAEARSILYSIRDQNFGGEFMTELHPKIPRSTSYSMIAATDEDGFYLNVFPYSHRFNPKDSQFHMFQMVKLYIPRNCFIIFNSRLLHGGAASREYKNGKTMPDTRVFSYILPKDDKDNGRKSEDNKFPDHRSVYYPKDAHHCGYLNGVQEYCSRCSLRGFDEHNFYTIDVTVLYPKGYKTIKDEIDVGQVIFGELHPMGFSIVHGPKVTKPLRDKIKGLSDAFKTRWSGLTSQHGRVLVVPPAESGNALVDYENKHYPGVNNFASYLDSILSICKGITNSKKDIYLYKHNIIFNRSPVPQQTVHYDYRITGVDYKEEGVKNPEDQYNSSSRRRKRNSTIINSQKSQSKIDGHFSYTESDDLDNVPLSTIRNSMIGTKKASLSKLSNKE